MIINLLLPHILFITSIPIRQLPKFSKLHNQIHFRVFLILDQLKNLNDIGIIQFLPNPNLILDLVNLLFHLHLTFIIIERNYFIELRLSVDLNSIGL